MKQIGIHAVVSIITYLLMIALSFRSLQSLRLDKFFKKGHTFEIQLFILFASIALGYLVGQFLLALIDQSLAIRMLFS
ncbi:DUF1146 family protein [uncultured Lactobacillus sp.]|uniref:DUF1146 family protein n=1 Tax=uncultured Lactobacillus sp. TaxID=153152 RepID=UPI0026231E5D|nr:DUF1146 family protein [uncultured Lactobacillus sp.]